MLRQAAIQNSQVSNGIVPVQVCIVFVAKRAQLEGQFRNSQVSNGIVQVCIVLVAKRARLEAQVEGLTRTDGSSDNTLGSASSVLVVIS